MTDKESQQFVFGSIFLLANKLQILGDKVTQEITLKQWFLLNMLYKSKKTAPSLRDIANAIGSSRQNASKMLALLEQKGMVELQPSKSGHHTAHVTLTQKCLDYFSSKENAGNTLLDKMFEGIPPEETKRVASLLGTMIINLGELENLTVQNKEA